MLVLTRKSNQSIMIGDDIEVSVLSIMGEKVRIGIQAPRDVPVFRREVYLEIQQERGNVGTDARPEVDRALHKMSSEGYLAHDRVEHAEHDHGDEDRRGEEREDERD